MLMNIPLPNYGRAWKVLAQPTTYEQIMYAAEHGYRLFMDPGTASYVVVGRGQVMAQCACLENAALIAALLAAFTVGAPATGAISSLSQAGESLAPGLAQGDQQ